MSRHLRSISVRLHVRKVNDSTGRTRRAFFSQLQSDMEEDITNEFPLLVHALTIASAYRENARRGFPYTLGRFFLS